jgi:hypothetical protein
MYDYRHEAAKKGNLSVKGRLGLLSWHGWATNKQEKLKALDHHGCLACPGRVDLLPGIAIKLIRRNQGLRHRRAVQALGRCTKIPKNPGLLSAFPAVLENHFLGVSNTSDSRTEARPAWYTFSRV